jgi:hypothetical protein
MNQTDFEALIALGLPQPQVEPEFFTYPVGYDLIATSTSYSLSIDQHVDQVQSVTQDAGLGTGFKGTSS